jgi:DNA-binding NarL/FixJ family response regulator
MSMLAAMLNPLAYYALLAVGLSLSLYLFVTLKSELRSIARRHQEGQQQVLALQAALGEARAAAQSLETDLREVERQTGMLVAPQPARSGLNLSKRTQVLRMHRSGHDNAGIAAALALPRAEVDLLIKVHRLVLDQI